MTRRVEEAWKESIGPEPGRVLLPAEDQSQAEGSIDRHSGNCIEEGTWRAHPAIAPQGVVWYGPHAPRAGHSGHRVLQLPIFSGQIKCPKFVWLL